MGSIFGRKETVREVQVSPPTPPAEPPAPPTRATASTSAAVDPASGRTDATGGRPIASGPGAVGTASLINTSTQGLQRKANTQKRSLIGGA